MITVEKLREILSYDADTGVFRWRVTTAQRVAVGDEEGSVEKAMGYIRIMIGGKTYLAHRIAWIYMHGRWPANQIDHINRKRSDNRFTNLREATHAENQRNTPKYKNNTSGYKGVFRHGNRFQAGITAGSKRIHLGTFDDPEHAAAAYRIAAAALHGDFARSE